MFRGSRQAANIALLAAGEGVGRLLAFGLTALIARAYGLTELAILSACQAFIAYASIAGDGGLNQEATRRLVGGEDRGIVYRDAARTQFVYTSGAVCLVLALVAVSSPAIFLPLLCFAPVPLAAAISTPYLLDAVGRFGEIAVSRILMSLVTTVVGLVMIAVGVPAWLFGLAYSLGAIAAAWWTNLRGRRPRGVILQHRSAASRSARRRTAWRLGQVAVLLHVHSSLPILIASRFSDNRSFQDMGVVTRVWFIASAVIVMSGSVLLPSFGRSLGRKKVFVAIAGFVLYSLLALLLFWAAGGPLLNLLFGPDASRSFVPVLIYLAGLVPASVAAVCASALIAMHRESGMGLAYGVGILALICVVVTSSDGASSISLSVAWLLSQFFLAGWLGVMLVMFIRGDARRSVGSRVEG